MKEYIVDVISVRVKLPDDLTPESPISQGMIIRALEKKAMEGETIAESYFEDES